MIDQLGINDYELGIINQELEIRIYALGIIIDELEARNYKVEKGMRNDAL